MHYYSNSKDLLNPYQYNPFLRFFKTHTVCAMEHPQDRREAVRPADSRGRHRTVRHVGIRRLSPQSRAAGETVFVRHLGGTRLDLRAVWWDYIPGRRKFVLEAFMAANAIHDIVIKLELEYKTVRICLCPLEGTKYVSRLNSEFWN